MFKTVSRLRQSGFTAIELIFVLAVLGIMYALSTQNFSLGGASATAAISAARTHSDALIRLRADASCFPQNMRFLYEQDAGGLSTIGYCGLDLKSQWKGPYIQGQGNFNATGALLIEKLGPGVTMQIATAPNNAINMTEYFLRFDNLPAEITREVLEKCNGTDVANNKGKCSVGATPWTAYTLAAGQLGTVQTLWYHFDSSRGT